MVVLVASTHFKLSYIYQHCGIAISRFFAFQKRTSKFSVK